VKKSRRHRWLEFTDGNKPRMAVCRDCGLEIASQDIKSGGHGLCAGKACEHQHVLGLMNLGPQEIGIELPADSHIACMGCGTTIGLKMMAHRCADTSMITGWVFGCEACEPVLVDRGIVLAPKEEDSEAS